MRKSPEDVVRIMRDEPWNEEAKKIAEMIIPLGKATHFMNGHPITEEMRRDFNITQWAYTCKHFNTKTRDCMNYENRPQMCRDYGLGGTCDVPNCTLR